jgi:hypothetical protein
MRFRLPVVTFAALAVIAACSKPDPVASNVAATNLPLPVNDSTPDPAGGPPANAIENHAAAPTAGDTAPIPASLRGRWGLTPADCTGPLASAKGLLVIGPNQLNFYESRAVPAADVATDAGATRGTFHFSGEGQTWDKFESLKRSGDRLTRTEGNPTASYTYAKC